MEAEDDARFGVTICIGAGHEVAVAERFENRHHAFAAGKAAVLASVGVP